MTGRQGLPNAEKQFVALANVQAAFYAFTGVWALVSIRTFQMVTGPKADLWLVKTVGLLVMVIGAVLGVAGRRRSWSPEVCLLGGGSAAVLAGVDVVYVARGRISRVYLLDALAELCLVAAWAHTWTRRPRSRGG